MKWFRGYGYYVHNLKVMVIMDREWIGKMDLELDYGVFSGQLYYDGYEGT